MIPNIDYWREIVTRAGLISNSDYIKNHDVLVLQECFDLTACDAIRSGLASQCKTTVMMIRLLFICRRPIPLLSLTQLFFSDGALLDPYQTPTVGHSKSGWDSTSGSYSSTSVENGGVTILSKWPIKQKHQFVYKNGCGADW